MANLDITDLSPEELILAIMHFSGGSIPGALYLQKLVFLAVNEDEKRKEALEKKVKFRPLNFGPYSDPVTDAVHALESQGMVVSKRQLANKYNREIFMLTDAGRRLSEERVRALNRETQSYLRNVCLAARQLGYSGILRYVYSKYPKSTSKSKIKGEVFKSYDY